MDDLVNGIISGAIAGLVVSVILGAYRLIVAKCRRKDQIEHIREMITNERETIYSVEVGNIPAEPFGPTPDAFRYILFSGIHQELELSLDGRSSEITFDESRQIRRAFVVHDDLYRRLPTGHYPEGVFLYDRVFEQLENIDWLKLPKLGVRSKNPGR